MELFGYGEDALTLWALTSRLSTTLHELNDLTSPSNCRVFFRPSFGRRGGSKSSQFGEFDFILLSKDSIYLGESKWDKSSEIIVENNLTLKNEQLLRHDLFKFYLENWAFGGYQSWKEFSIHAKSRLEQISITKPVAPDGSLLATNLRTILNVIREYYQSLPRVQNLLLYFYDKRYTQNFPDKAGIDFQVLRIDYSVICYDQFIRIDL